MAKGDRMKASDVFRNTTFFFGAKTTFEQAYPTIEELRVEVTERGWGVNERNHTLVYHNSEAGEYINCRNPQCYNGGFRLGSILFDMVHQQKTEFHCSRPCQGYEGSPKGRKSYGPCDNHFEIKVTIKYKAPAETAERTEGN